MCSLSKNNTANTTRTPEIRPIIKDEPTLTNAHGAVIATKPAKEPFTIMDKSGLPNTSHAVMVELRIAAAAAVLVVTAMCAIALPSPTAIVEPGLNPNQPNHSTSAPSVTVDMLCPKIGFAEPSLRYLSMRGPNTSAPAKPAQPPTECTTDDPAKSHMPRDCSHPPPQIQWPVTGYITPTKIAEKTINDTNLMRSATTPETMVAAVPANTN